MHIFVILVCLLSASEVRMEVFVILVMLTVCKRGQDVGIRHTGYVDCLLARSGWRYVVILVMLTVCWRGQDGGICHIGYVDSL